MAYDFSALKNHIDNFVIGKIAPFADILILYKGEEVYRYTTGYTDEEKKIPYTTDQLLDVYSASKVITCTAGMIAMEQGLFLPGDPVSDYIPDFGKYYIKKENGKEEIVENDLPPVIQDLFSMSAGLDYNRQAKEIVDVVKANPNATTKDIILSYAKRPLAFKTEEKWCYSLCHDVLAYVIEVASGMRFADFVKKYIFEPLEMNNSYFHLPKEMEDKKAQKFQYYYSRGKYEPTISKNLFVFTDNYDSGGAGVITNINDYKKFAYALVNGGVGKNGKKIISRQSIDLMRTNVLDEKRLASYRADKNNYCYGYGFGVRVKMDPGRGGNLAREGEFGWDGAAGFLVSLEPENDLAILYAQHTLDPHNYENHNRIRNLVHLALFD